jgi:hypothetical protein
MGRRVEKVSFGVANVITSSKMRWAVHAAHVKAITHTRCGYEVARKILLQTYPCT